MAHPPAWGSGLSRNKRGDGFVAVGFNPVGCLFLSPAADFPDQKKKSGLTPF